MAFSFRDPEIVAARAALRGPRPAFHDLIKEKVMEALTSNSQHAHVTVLRIGPFEHVPVYEIICWALQFARDNDFNGPVAVGLNRSEMISADRVRSDPRELHRELLKARCVVFRFQFCEGEIDYADSLLPLEDL